MGHTTIEVVLKVDPGRQAVFRKRQRTWPSFIVALCCSFQAGLLMTCAVTYEGDQGETTEMSARMVTDIFICKLILAIFFRAAKA